jgi:hypothetical protein
MNSPLEHRKVRLRGLGGPAACGFPRTCASAIRRSPNQIRNEHDSPLGKRNVRLRGRLVQPVRMRLGDRRPRRAGPADPSW